MSIFKVKQEEYKNEKIDGEYIISLPVSTVAKFDAKILDLGTLSNDSTSIDAIAAVFDLKDFTKFCDGRDVHLKVPLFLNKFLHWFMNQIKMETTIKEENERVSLYCPLPLLVKFMGDGLLVLWDVSQFCNNSKDSIVFIAHEICRKYSTHFCKQIKSYRLNDAPTILRCGLAQGQVYSVGDGNDFIGPCINIAARLEKAPGSTFTYSLTGFHLNESEIDFLKEDFISAKLIIRGIAGDETIAILAEEYEKMDSETRLNYKIVT